MFLILILFSIQLFHHSGHMHSNCSNFHQLKISNCCNIRLRLLGKNILSYISFKLLLFYHQHISWFPRSNYNSILQRSNHLLFAMPYCQDILYDLDLIDNTIPLKHDKQELPKNHEKDEPRDCQQNLPSRNEISFNVFLSDFKLSEIRC